MNGIKHRRIKQSNNETTKQNKQQTMKHETIKQQNNKQKKSWNKKNDDTKQWNNIKHKT